MSAARSGSLLKLFILFILFFCASARAEDLSGLLRPAQSGPATTLKAPASPVRAELVADVSAVQPGHPFRLGVRFRIDPGWHIYGRKAGDAGEPPKIQWELPDGFRAGEIEWPEPRRFELQKLVSYGYVNDVVLYAPVSSPASLAASPAGAAYFFKASVHWIACRESCMPGEAMLRLDLPPLKGAPPALSALPPLLFSPQARQSVWWYLLLALLGGALLNIMPCVLPVLSLKVLSFVRQAGESRPRTLRLGLSFAAGVLASFAVLAGVLIALRAAGTQVGWGFQFQEPRFVIVMAAGVLAFALSLFGVFSIELPGRAATKMDQIIRREGPGGAFLSGALATLLATPCTAPLLGPALGFALTQPGWLIVLFFLTTGLGLSGPYVLLAARPDWLKKLPRPGRWSEIFKQAMGFLLLLTVVWLLAILARQVDAAAVIWTLLFLLAVALGCWLIGLGLASRGARRRRLSWMAALVLIGSAFFVFPERYLHEYQAGQRGGTGSESLAAAKMKGLDWQPFSVERLRDLVNQGQSVFVDFSADWCLTCKANELWVLDSDRVRQAFKNHGVVAMKADWTTRDQSISRILNQFERNSVPLYVIFPAHQPDRPMILPVILTPRIIEERLDQLKTRPARPTSMHSGTPGAKAPGAKSTGTPVKTGTGPSE